jgi:hypothetical protein
MRVAMASQCDRALHFALYRFTLCSRQRGVAGAYAGFRYAADMRQLI